MNQFLEQPEQKKSLFLSERFHQPRPVKLTFSLSAPSVGLSVSPSFFPNLPGPRSLVTSSALCTFLSYSLFTIFLFFIDTSKRCCFFFLQHVHIITRLYLYWHQFCHHPSLFHLCKNVPPRKEKIVFCQDAIGMKRAQTFFYFCRKLDSDRR